jgi:hypothetical protein
MGFTPRPASGHTRPHDATIMYHQNIQCKVGVTGTGADLSADATFVMKIRIKKLCIIRAPCAREDVSPRSRAPRSRVAVAPRPRRRASIEIEGHRPSSIDSHPPTTVHLVVSIDRDNSNFEVQQFQGLSRLIRASGAPRAHTTQSPHLPRPQTPHQTPRPAPP